MKAKYTIDLKNFDILLTGNTGIIPLLIQLFTRSKVNHAEIYYEGKLYGAEQDGFNQRELKKNKKYIVKRYNNTLDSDKALNALKELIGVPYDFDATLLAQPLHQVIGNWKGDKSIKDINCSQAAAYIINKATGKYISWYKISPDELLEDFENFDTYFTLLNNKCLL